MTTTIVSTGLDKGLVINQTGSGTLTTTDDQQPNGFNFNFIKITDAIDGPTNQSYSTQGLAILHKVGGSAVEGTRTALYSEANLTAATSTSNTNRFWAGGGFVGRVSANDGGTTGTPHGAIFGGYSSALIDAGSNAHLANATAWEFGISVPSGNTVGYKSLVQLAAMPGDAVQGSFETMVALSGNSGSVGWERAFSLTDANGRQPLTTTGSIFSCNFVGSATIANGFDISPYTITGNAFKSNGFSVDGAGNVTAKNINTAGCNNVIRRVAGFEIWQRGTSVAVASSSFPYTCDGWYLANNAGQNAHITQVAGLISGSRFAAKIQRDSGQTGTGTMIFACPLDSDEIAQLAGNYVAMSFTAKAGANWSPSAGTLYYTVYAGTGPVQKRRITPYTSETQPINGSANLTTTATRYSLTTGAVVPAGTTQMEIQFVWIPNGTAGADDSFTVDDVQLEIVSSASASATAFKRDSYSDVLGDCKRHLMVYVPGATNYPVGLAQAYSTSQFLLPFHYDVEMRSTPAFTLSSAGDFYALNASNSASLTLSALAVNFANTRLAELVGTAATASLAAGNATAVRALNSSATLVFSAEI